MKRLVIALMFVIPMRVVAADTPVIRLPLEGERVGAQLNDLCPYADKPCRRVHAEGSVPNETVGIFAVEPLNASPTIWIQPFARDVFGGNVSATVYLGTVNVGAREEYRVYLLACKAGHGLEPDEETTLKDIRHICQWSMPVTVYRER